MADAKEMSMFAALVAVLSQLDGIFTVKKNTKMTLTDWLFLVTIVSFDYRLALARVLLDIRVQSSQWWGSGAQLMSALAQISKPQPGRNKSDLECAWMWQTDGSPNHLLNFAFCRIWKLNPKDSSNVWHSRLYKSQKTIKFQMQFHVWVL